MDLGDCSAYLLRRCQGEETALPNLSGGYSVLVAVNLRPGDSGSGDPQRELLRSSWSMGRSDPETAYPRPIAYKTRRLQCWISKEYAFERLWLHYFWIFVAMFGTVMLYTLIYVTL